MLAHSHNALNGIFTLDLSGLAFDVDKTIINDHHTVEVNRQEICITITGPYQTYEIIFGKIHKNVNLKIIGSEHNVIISESDINIRRMKVQALHAVIEEDCSLKSAILEQTSEKFDVYGNIDIDVMTSHFILKKYGLCNYGTLSIRESYHQKNGSLINAGKLKIAALLLEYGDIVCNKPGAHWEVTDKQQLNCETLYFDGIIYNCMFIQVVANYIHILPSAEFQKCGHLILTALSALKCYENSKIDVLSFTAQAVTLFIETVIIANSLISLLGQAYMIVREAAGLVAPTIDIRVLDVFVFGKLIGQVNFDDVRHLYLADSSVIENCRDLKVMTFLTEAYGKIVSESSYLNSQLAVETSSSSDFISLSSIMISNHITLAGLMNIQSFQLKAVEQLMMQKNLQLKGEKATLIAGGAALAGQISTNMEVQAVSMTNAAIIDNDKRTLLAADKVLINKIESRIQTGEAVLDVPEGSMLNLGQVAAVQTVHERAKDLHLATNSKTSAEKATLLSHTMHVGGNVNCTQSLHGHSKKSIRYLTGNHLKAPETIMQSEDEMAGPLNLKSNTATLTAERSADLLCGTIVSKEKITVASHSVLLDTKVDANELVLVEVKKENDKASDLLLGQEANIKAKIYYQNFTGFASYGKLNVHQGYQDSKQSIHYFPTSETHISKQMVNKTEVFIFSGKLTSTFSDSKEAGFFVYADSIRYTATTETDILLPIRNEAISVSYAGIFNAAAVSAKADKTTFERDCNITDKTWEVSVEGRSKSATLEVEKGANIDSREFFARTLKAVAIRGAVTSRQIMMDKIDDLLIAMRAQLGNMDTKMQLDIDRITLQGRMEGTDINIKCEDYFFLDGLHGEARIRATRANITTPKFVDVLGVTEAQQLNVSSFLSCVLGFRIVNWNVSNAIISIRFIPQVIHLEFLLNAIEDIRQGRINILDPQYLQYSLQMVLTLLQNIIPRFLSLGINIVASSFFLFNNLKQIKKLYQEIDFDNCRDVDLVPLLVAVKNSLVSSVNIAQSSVSMAEEFGVPVWDTIADYIESLGDLGKDFCDFFHLRSNQKDPGQHPSDSKQNENKKDDNSEPKPPVPVSTVWEDISKWWSDFNCLNSLNDAVMKYVSPIVSILGPFNMEDSIISIKVFNPILGSSSSERSVFEFTYGSPVVGMARSITGLAVFTFDTNVVYILNLSSSYLYLGKSITIPYVVNIKADYIEKSQGIIIRPAIGVLQQSHLQPLDFKASRSLTFVCDKVDDMRKLLELSGQYQVFRPEKVDQPHCVITYDIRNYDFNFTKSQRWDWGVVFKGRSVYIADGINLLSKGDMLGFISTIGSVIAYGNLYSHKTIYVQSADKVYFFKMKSNSAELYIIAYNDVQLIKSYNHCNEGAVISQRKNVEVLGGKLKADEFVYVGARRKIIDNCVVKNTHHHHKKDKKYESGTIEGGKGKYHKGVGLYAEGEELNLTASNIGADGNVILNINHMVKAEALHNRRVHKVNHHLTLYGYTKEVVVTEHIRRPRFFSKDGKVIVVSKREGIETLGALFDAPAGTLLISRTAPVFKEFVVRTETLKTETVLFVPVSKTRRVEDEYYSAVITKTDLFGVSCKYGDCYAEDITIDAKVVITDCAGGQFVVRNRNIQVHEIKTYLTLSLNAGPLRVQHTFNPDALHATTYDIDDPLLNLVIHSKHLHDNADAATTGVNLADAAVAKGGALMEGNYLEAAGCSVGVSGTVTTTVTNSEIKGRHFVSVDAWIDTSRDGVRMVGLDGDIGRFSTTSNKFIDEGTTVKYSSHSTSATVGVSYNPLTQQVSGSAGLAASSESGEKAMPSHLHIRQFIAWNSVDVVVDNAGVTIDEAHGDFQIIDVTSGLDIGESKSFSISGSTTGSASFSEHHGSHQKNVVSYVEIKNHSDDCQIDHVHLVGAELRGDGVKDIPSESIEYTAVKNKEHESGVSVSVNFKDGPPVTNVGFENTTNGHGVSVSVNTPVNLFNLFKTQKKAPTAPAQDAELVEEQIEVMENVASLNSAAQTLLTSDTVDQQNQTYIAVYNADGKFCGFVIAQAPANNKVLSKNNENQEQEEEHEGWHYHFPTPDEIPEIVNIPNEFFDEVLYRGDDIAPEKALNEGIKARNQKIRLVHTDQQIVTHVRGMDGGSPNDSVLVATSRDMNVARTFPTFVEEYGYKKSYIFIMKNRYGTVDINPRLERFDEAASENFKLSEMEVGFPYQIRNNEIIGYYVNERVFVGDNISPVYLISEEMIKNPNYSRYISWTEFNAKGLSGCLTVYAVLHDAHSIYDASKQGFIAELSETVRVAGTWAGAAYATSAAIHCLPKVVFRNPYVSLAVTTASGLIGANVEDILMGTADRVLVEPIMHNADIALHPILDNAKFAYHAFRDTGQALFSPPPVPTVPLPPAVPRNK